MFKIYNLSKKILIIIICTTIVFLVNGSFEYLIVHDKLQEFKDRAEFITQDKIIPNTYYYKVKPKFDYEDTTRNIFNFDRRWVGSKADIIITNRNPMRDSESKLFASTIGFLSTNFFVGHATLNINESGSKLIEVLGNSYDPEDNIVVESNNNWITVEEYLGEDGYSPLIIGLRIKNTTEDQRNQIVDYAKTKIGLSYNYTFLFNRSNTFYCTDLVSRSISSVGMNVNYDYLATTGNDIIVSKNVYIIFIREVVIEEGVYKFNYYYLG